MFKFKFKFNLFNQTTEWYMPYDILYLQKYTRKGTRDKVRIT